MNSERIYKEILMLSDDELLKTLPTIEKESCSECSSIDIRRRKDNSFYCNQCKKTTKTVPIAWYWKNKTSNPTVAIERHRIFWNKIYYIELAKENYIEPVKYNPISFELIKK